MTTKHRRRRLVVAGGIIIIIMTALLAALGCSASSNGNPAQSPTLSNQLTQPPGTPVGSPTTGVLGGSGSAARLGQPFDLPITALDSQETFRVTVVSVTPTAQLDQQILSESHTTAPAPPGSKWIVVKFELTNTGHSRAYWSPGVTGLVVGADTYSQTDADTAATQLYNSHVSNSGANTSAFAGLNPGATGTTYGIWDIPVSATPTALHIPTVLGSANVNQDTPAITVDLR